MTAPTWGIYIPGYSYPSPAQRKKFEHMYPGAAARHREEQEEALERMFAEQRREVEEDRKRHQACTHLFVPTNLDDAHVCRHCRMWVETLSGAPFVGLSAT